MNIDEEIALIKSKLSFLKYSKDTESPFNLSKISEKPDDYPALSLISSTLIESKNYEYTAGGNSLQPEKEENAKNNNELIEKNKEIERLKQLGMQMRDQLILLEQSILQYEVDIEYCMEQNKLAYNEIRELQNLALKKDEIIEKLKIQSNGPLFSSGKVNYKIYSELELYVILM